MNGTPCNGCCRTASRSSTIPQPDRGTGRVMEPHRILTAHCVGLMRLSGVGRWLSQQPGTKANRRGSGPGRTLTRTGFMSSPVRTPMASICPEGRLSSLQLRWNDSWLASSKDLDLYLVDSNFYTVKSSTLPQAGLSGDTPFEYLSFTAPYSGLYRLAVERYAGAPPAWLQVQVFSSQRLAVYTGRSVGNPAETANPGALAVGAANWATPAVIESLQQHWADAR